MVTHLSIIKNDQAKHTKIKNTHMQNCEIIVDSFFDVTAISMFVFGEML